MRKFRVLSIMMIVGLLLSACATPTAQIIEKEVTKIVTEEKVVKETVVVKEEVEVTKVVEKSVEVEKVVTATPLPPSAYKESPILAGLVAAGELPPLDERLPLHPAMVESLTGEEGQFGGQMRFGMVGTSATW
ncbi:MAG: hypothetical protein JW934_20570, partial [Anaerolineae bacterium]|nr:hypothetical protein [Anaerolineae bacterium]